MTKAEKIELAQKLYQEIKSHNGFYIVDTTGFTAQEAHQFRAECYKAQLRVKCAKNSIIKKSLEATQEDYSAIYPALKQSSTIIFVKDAPNQPAKLIKSFRESNEKLKLKGAWIDKTVFLGNESLDSLISLKSKAELIGEIVGLLQSPIQNLIGSLQGQGQKLAAILQAISEKKSS
ncbi:MAG: 50S ribosomal protein L10 [Bacteroidia bacterium]|nr:50S ribosomal protein L10 [Bacteroidia bacterium]MDW8158652.1 50S ribosomal protein L10 [Bacteroidia bacterium]